MAILPAVMVLTLAACGGGGGGGTAALAETNNAELRQYMQGPQTASYALSAIGASPSGGVGSARGQGVSVAVIDSEIDDGHPDLRKAFIRDRNGNAIGRNVVEGHNDTRPVAQRLRRPRSDIVETASAEQRRQAEQQIDTTLARSISHGTHVSGIIGARDNGYGVVGVAPEATLVPVALFRDRDSTQYNRYGLSGLNESDLPEWNQRIAASVNYAADRNAFVINNSWGFPWFPYEIRSTDSRAVVPYYFRLPNFFLNADPVARTNLHRQIFDAKAIAAWERAVANGAAVVFATGNDGWNSETGEHKIFASPLLVNGKHRTWTDYRNDEVLDYIRTVARRVTNNDGSGGSVLVPANIPDLESSYFVTNGKLKGSWLAVVNVNKQNVIHWSSNGCGIARNYCLAAPGTNVRSTLVRGDKDDVKDQDAAVAKKRLTGDINSEAEDGYGTKSGTSMAAPVVSGALAVLKSSAPNLSARAAVKILLCTATDLDRTEGRPTKSIEECAEKGPEATHANGWTPSEVYGHGLVNLARALQPIGPTRAAAADAFGIAPTADTRVAFSAAFGDAAPSAEHHFGGFDSLGRVYRFRAPLQDRVMPGPRLAGMLAATTPPEILALGRSDEMTTLLRRSASPDSALGDGQKISFLSARHRTDLSFISARHGGALSPAALLRREGMPPLWDSLAPRARDIIASRSEWRLADGLRAGIFFTRARMQAATRRGEAYSIRDYGLSGRLGVDGNLVEARFGRLIESGRFLGSKPDGGYALARPTESTYLRLSASRRLTGRLSVGADLARLRSRVDFRHDAFVQDTVLRAGSSSVHLAFRDAAVVGDRLVLQHGRPLAVTGGVMRQSSVTGYDPAGAYRVTTRELDLAVRDRHRLTQLVYQRPLAGRLSGFAAAAHHRRWSHRRGLSNNLVMLGVSLAH